MATSIDVIKQKNAYVDRTIKISGKNLIIVGDNGAGKTRFLNELKNILDKVVFEKKYESVKELEKQLKEQQDALLGYEKDTQHYNNFVNSISIIEMWLEEKKPFELQFNSTSDLLLDLKSNHFVFRFFPADRYYKHSSRTLLTSVEILFEEYKDSSKASIVASDFFESYLVSMSNYALLEKGAGEIAEYNKVSSVIHSIEKDLKELYEDESLEVSFNRKRLRMEIKQKNKEPFDFEKLSSGYSSILSIYSELIMLSELSEINKAEMRGVIVIDEIDAHLHVTLQKKVFEFFSNSFPKIQFIISTHSPFVIQSVSDAVIYNLTHNEQMEDLSIYSYTSIIKGLLGESSNSDDLEGLLKELTELTAGRKFGARFHELIALLDEKNEHLDVKAKAILLNSKSKLIDWEEDEGNV